MAQKHSSQSWEISSCQTFQLSRVHHNKLAYCSFKKKRSWVRFPLGALLVLGAGSPQAISRALLCGVCMFPPCSQGVSSTKNPNRKNMQKNRTLSCPSLTKTDGSLDLVPGRHKRLPTAPGCPGGRTVQDGKMQRKNSLRPLRHACVCVCVCPVSPP